MSKKQIREMVLLAILTAIIILFTFTPVGYLKIPPIEVTFLPVVVAVGAILTGPIGGAYLGAVFGVTSLIQCFTGSVFGAFLFGLSPVLTVFICIVPRILCGMIPGFLFRVLQKRDRTKLLSYAAASVSTALLNTIFFVGCILLFFWHNETFTSTMAASGLNTDSVWLFLVGFVGFNGLLEALVSCVAGTAIGKVLVKLRKD